MQSLAHLFGALLSALLEADEFRRCSIYVMDIAKDLDLDQHTCDLDTEVVSHQGAVYGSHDSRWASGDVELFPHFHSQHSGPFWLNQSLAESGLLAANMDEADAVFVYDYCYSTVWLSLLHSGPNVEHPTDPRAALAEAYDAIVELPRFNRSGGKGFALFFSHPLQGAMHAGVLCTELRDALHITVESAHNRVCADDVAKNNQLVVPYSSPAFVSDRKSQAAEKTIFAFFLASCASDVRAPIGKRMRSILERALEPLFAERGVATLIKCSVKLPHEDVRHLMRRSQFCLLTVGDTASSRRLTDSILAGCIPVFLGPPWHTMPLAAVVDYRALGVHIYVEEYAQMAEAAGFTTLEHMEPGAHAKTVFDPAWWIPDVDVSDAWIRVATVAHVADVLQALSSDVIMAKQRAVRAAESFFMYRRPPAGAEQHPNIVDVIVDNLCRRVD